jgi:hypothetical protein
MGSGKVKKKRVLSEGQPPSFSRGRVNTKCGSFHCGWCHSHSLVFNDSYQSNCQRLLPKHASRVSNEFPSSYGLHLQQEA